eukprot:1724323-Pyramimonas_sp.AAC.1
MRASLLGQASARTKWARKEWAQCPTADPLSCCTGLAVHAPAACVHSRQRAACPTAAAVGLGQH